MDKPILLLILLCLFSSSTRAVTIKNSTNNSFYVISTYTDSIIKIGYKVKPGRECNITPIYNGIGLSSKISINEYIYPKSIYFYNKYRDAALHSKIGESLDCEDTDFAFKIDAISNRFEYIEILSINKIIISVTSSY